MCLVYNWNTGLFFFICIYIFLFFSFQGKLLNVREASHKQILENAEINNIIKILGLQYKKQYETDADMKTLRYGKLMIMTDQDQVWDAVICTVTDGKGYWKRIFAQYCVHLPKYWTSLESYEGKLICTSVS